MPKTLVAAVLVLVALSPVAGQQKRVITEHDLMAFVWTADPQMSPDGTQVVFTRVVVNQAKDDYETSLWLVPSTGASAPRPLTAGPRDTSPRWSPDGKTLAFVRAVEKDGKTQPPQIYVLPFTGGEAAPVTNLPRGASGPVWSPDGTRLVFASSTKDGDFAPPGPKSDVRVITSAVYRSNGGGWDDPERPSHLWVTSVRPGAEPAKATALTSGRFSESGAVWSADGSRVFFVSNPVDEPYYLQSDADLFAVPASGGPAAKVASINGTISAPRLSPDRKWLAFAGNLYGTPERSFDQTDLFVAPVDGASAPRNLTSGRRAAAARAARSGPRMASRSSSSPASAATPTSCASTSAAAPCRRSTPGPTRCRATRRRATPRAWWPSRPRRPTSTTCSSSTPPPARRARGKSPA